MRYSKALFSKYMSISIPTLIGWADTDTFHTEAKKSGIQPGFLLAILDVTDRLIKGHVFIPFDSSYHRLEVV